LLSDWLRDNESLYAQAADLGLILVLYAPQGMATAAPTILQFASANPNARIVVTHLGNPQLRDARPAETELLKLAAAPGVFVQLSGLSQFCEYPHAELDELVRATIREFGAPRIYWGSNYPVCGDSAAYVRDLRHVLGGEWGLTSEQIDSITLRTAERLWFPDAPPRMRE
jgi:predicted TIM-barrel fold metal-dependent hydrolase